MAFKRINDMRRLALRTALKIGIGGGTFAVGTSILTTPALAQLRTGRTTDREFYQASEPAEAISITHRKTKSKTKSAVVQASATDLVFSEEVPVSEPVKKPSNAVHRPSGSNTSSRVIQAGCKNCQAGIAHSHRPIAARSSQEDMIEDNSQFDEPSVLSDNIHDPNSMVFGSSCERCRTSCGPAILIQPPGILSSLLRRMQFRIEAATFWPDGQNLPQLVTTRRPENDPATDGLIGEAETVNLFGGSEVLGGAAQGVRGELGSYLDEARTHGFLFRFFDGGSNSLTFSSTPTSEPVVTRPFFSTADNAQSTVAVNFPNSTSGSLNANISSEVYGGDILYRKLILKDCAGRIEFLTGYQTARLADSLLISSTTTALFNTPAPAGTISQITDRFSTVNRFNGIALGFSGILRERQWSLSGMVKLGLGNMENSVSIDGSSTITVPGNPSSTSTTADGLLARNTNQGNYAFNTFVVTPETNLTFGYRLTRRLEATVGYSYLGLPKVARVADQLDPQLASNLSNPPIGARTPSFSLRESNYSLHSLDYGLQWRY